MDPALTTGVPPAEAFGHVRIIIGMILGLCVSRLLTGLARFIQHPGKQKIYPVHLAWVGFILLSVIHFWWFEFSLRTIPLWTFEKYLFVIFYAGLYFLLCTLLFPDSMEEYTGYRDYFISRRKWFFGILALVYVADFIDTLLKGADHYRLYGTEYPIQVAGFILFSLIAVFWDNRRYHAIFAAAALIYQITFTLRHFATLS
ncbi:MULTISPECIES: hypothetical protein [Brucella]|jgi:hypothetical protein|uniref:Mll4938 protein n=2 Tax=Brucella anthropi TaxID=529 RepID=A6X613_BRUA4|nr:MULTISPECIES: hypothetical protein [Brucella/Ochrobactrum group]MCR5939470.1 hypothetical protein [Ochrobactrum sp. XJ1]QOD65879.1 hypothetical protein HGK82_22595 [Ochrobactrum sp. MT180101]QTN04598.1 hypothetical protein GTN27_15345 [Ochrobactrum sp. EEELCW01]ABS16667.1 conserved hypothetical protein [Brucella anthropi ATCC 49188]AIK42616.1 putative membrane protein [Brucella anthropi]